MVWFRGASVRRRTVRTRVPPERALGIRATPEHQVVARHGRNKGTFSSVANRGRVLYRPRPDKPFLVSCLHPPTDPARASHEPASQVANQPTPRSPPPNRTNHLVEIMALRIHHCSGWANSHRPACSGPRPFLLPFHPGVCAAHVWWGEACSGKARRGVTARLGLDRACCYCATA